MCPFRFDMMVVGIVVSAAVAAAHAARAEEAYDPVIDSASFTTKIDNPYFSLPIGRKMIYEAQTRGGLERIEIAISGETRSIMGVETLVYFEEAFVNGRIHEVTKDFLAQDRAGNVWYFGEEVENYTNGRLRDRKGSWMAGLDGAKPGIWIKAKLVPGDVYWQEYYRGQAEDMAKVVSIGDTVKVVAGNFKDCAKTLEWTPIEPAAKALKYYCPEAGGLVLIEHLRTGDRIELIKVENRG